MANILLQSAENSSLLQTLNQSESRVIPAIYSTKELYPATATSWFNEITPQSENYRAGGSMNWILPKYGFLQQILLSFKKSFKAAAAPTDDATIGIATGDGYRIIDRIEMLSSSRIISTLYAQDLLALHSNLKEDQLFPINETFISKGTEGAKLSDTVEQTFVLPIVFGFNNDINTTQNLSFNEPTSLRVVWGNPNLAYTNSGADPAVYTVSAGVGTLSEATLMLRYQLYNEADQALILSENYSEPQLNMLTTRQFRENPKNFAHPTAGAFTEDNIQLRNVDVINAFYIMVQPPPIPTGGTNEFGPTQNRLCEIDEITLTASGQEICKINFAQNYYSKLTENGYASTGVRASGAMALERIYKIQTGMWENSGGGTWSNGWSARELNNLTLTVKGRSGVLGTHTIIVCETTSTILSCNSQTGRIVNSLVN